VSTKAILPQIHLFNLPALSIIFDDIYGREMKIRRNKIRGLLSFFFHHDHGHFAQPFDGPNKSGDPKVFVLAIYEKRDLPISRIDGGKGSDLGFFTIHPNPLPFQRFFASGYVSRNPEKNSLSRIYISVRGGGGG